MLQENGITKEWRGQGFSLKEEGDHILELRYKGEFAARFSQTGTTIENILEVSQEVLRGRLN